jgi:predicted enzyme related to lactoylglutathione lyase
MTVRKSYKPGEFCWTDLGTTDVASAKKFYTAVFGCTVTDVSPGPGAALYSILRVKGKSVGALYPMTAADKKKKTKPAWIPYVSVKSVARSFAKAKALGAKVVDAPVAIDDAGRMAFMKDPTGAEFALWQPGTTAGAELEDVLGSVNWHDLNTKKTEAAGSFYAKMFGWKIIEQDFSGNNYFAFKLGKEPVCGMWPEPLSKLAPCWVTYWIVADCAKTVTTAKRLGGRALMGTTAVKGMGHFAILADAQGAAFGVISD